MVVVVGWGGEEECGVGGGDIVNSHSHNNKNNNKNNRIDHHIALSFAGLTADARVLISKAMLEAQV